MISSVSWSTRLDKVLGRSRRTIRGSCLDRSAIRTMARKPAYRKMKVMAAFWPARLLPIHANVRGRATTHTSTPNICQMPGSGSPLIKLGVAVTRYAGAVGTALLFADVPTFRALKDFLAGCWRQDTYGCLCGCANPLGQISPGLVISAGRNRTSLDLECQHGDKLKRPVFLAFCSAPYSIYSIKYVSQRCRVPITI